MRSPKAKRPRCKQCAGTGRMSLMVKPKGLMFPAEFKSVTCPTCKGTGREVRR